MSESETSGALAGTAAIVTGSAKNIGRGIALALASEGVSVLINARTSVDEAEAVASEIRSSGGRALVHMADVTQPDAADGMVAAAIEAFGRLDMLVNNIGVRRQTTLVETSDEDWRAVLNGCLDSMFFCCRAAVPHMKHNDWGGIVNIGGVSGHSGVALRTHVATAKAGMAGFTTSLASELAPDNITVNCIVPGHIDTERPGALPKHFQDREPPLGRPGTVEEIASTARFLLSPGGRYITGEVIHVNGGWYMTIA